MWLLRSETIAENIWQHVENMEKWSSISSEQDLFSSFSLERTSEAVSVLLKWSSHSVVDLFIITGYFCWKKINLSRSCFSNKKISAPWLYCLKNIQCIVQNVCRNNIQIQMHVDYNARWKHVTISDSLLLYSAVSLLITLAHTSV